jgi:spermidine synthase
LITGGLLVVQAMELSGLDYEDHRTVRDHLLRVFPVVRSYSTYIPSFWSEWGFLIASDGPDPVSLSREFLMERLSQRDSSEAKNLSASLDFYDPDAHFRMFALPKDVKKALNYGMLPHVV